MVSIGVQDNQGDKFLNEVDRLNIKVYSKEKEIKICESHIRSLKETVTRLTLGILNF